MNELSWLFMVLSFFVIMFVVLCRCVFRLLS